MANPIFDQFLEQWHEVVIDGNTAKIAELLDKEVVFYSPVVYTPQRGKFITSMYLSGASKALKNNFTYHRKAINGLFGVLEFTCMIDDLIVEGVDMIELNETGKIVSFKVMIRPLKAIHKVHEKMGKLLKQMK